MSAVLGALSVQPLFFVGLCYDGWDRDGSWQMSAMRTAARIQSLPFCHVIKRNHGKVTRQQHVLVRNRRTVGLGLGLGDLQRYFHTAPTGPSDHAGISQITNLIERILDLYAITRSSDGGDAIASMFVSYDACRSIEISKDGTESQVARRVEICVK